MYITIDRFEGNFAIIELEDLSHINMPKALFPHAREGDVFILEKAENQKKIREDKIKKLTKELFE